VKRKKVKNEGMKESENKLYEGSPDNIVKYIHDNEQPKSAEHILFVV
jgi:hypothetical protein